MERWADPDNPVTAAITGFARQVSDPVRLAVLQLLATEGPKAMSEIAEVLELPGPRLANHLARLRNSGMVTVRRSGRHAVYRIAQPRTAEVLRDLSALAGDAIQVGRHERLLSPLALAHTCYDHLAGRLGVGLFAAAVQCGALQAPEPDRANLRLGPKAAVFFDDLGVEVAALTPGRRKLAAACLDWLERRPHLAGAVGDSVLEAFTVQGLVTRTPDSRVLTITSQGLTRLQPFLEHSFR
jgi:DNA-binding transcriptional ArsR family regulator